MGSAVQGVAADITAGGGTAVPIRCDVSDPDDVERAVSAAIGAFGDLRILVANAGIGDRAPAADMTVEQWSRVIDVNLTGAWLFD